MSKALQRLMAQKHLSDFSAYVDPDQNYQRIYREAAHLRYISDCFMRVVRGESKRQLYFLPNRHLKSSQLTMKGLAFFVGYRYENDLPHQAMIISHTNTKAEEFSGYARNLVRDTGAYHEVFPTINMSRTRQSAASWGLLNKQGVEESFPSMSTGSILTPPTGGGADLLFIDDPIKSVEDANSVSHQLKSWESFNRGLKSRLNDQRDSAIVLVMTRWNQNDLAGRIMQAMAKEDAEQYEVICLPAIAYTPSEVARLRKFHVPVPDECPLGRKPGEALWPERFDEQWYAANKAEDARSFYSIGQQMPIPEGGNLIDSAWFKTLRLPPADEVRWVIAVDGALEEKQVAKDNPDYVAAGLIGLWERNGDRNDVQLIIGCMARTQSGYVLGKEFVARFAKAMRTLVNVSEIVVGSDNVDLVFARDLQGRADLLGYRIRTMKDRRMKRKAQAFKGDKATRASAWANRAEAGRVYLIEEAWSKLALVDAFPAANRKNLLGNEPLDWHESMLMEFEQFPHGANDDMVDVVSVGAHAVGAVRKYRRVASAAPVKGFG